MMVPFGVPNTIYTAPNIWGVQKGTLDNYPFGFTDSKFCGRVSQIPVEILTTGLKLLAGV